MAGHVVATHLSECGYNILSPNHKKLDLENMNGLRDFIESNDIDVIVNCAGILLGKSNDDVSRTIYLNSYLPHYLENLTSTSGVKIIHLSTDCVFSGDNGPYRDDSHHDGRLLYDRSKSLGEINNDKDLTFRMSIIGPELKRNGEGLFQWFMSQPAGSTIYGFKDVLWNGITTIVLARAVDSAIRQDIMGVYHLVPNTNISKLDLLRLINSTFRRGVFVEPKVTIPSNKTLLKGRNDFDFEVPNYSIMIEDMYDWISAHNDLYRGIYPDYTEGY